MTQLIQRRNKKNKKTRQEIKKHMSISEQLRKYNLVDDQFLLKLKEIPLEHLIAVKLEDMTTVMDNNKFTSVSFLYYLQQITKEGFYLSLLSNPGKMQKVQAILRTQGTSKLSDTTFNELEKVIKSRICSEIVNVKEKSNNFQRLELIQLYAERVPVKFVNKKLRTETIKKQLSEKKIFSELALYAESLLEKYQNEPELETSFINSNITNASSFDDFLNLLTSTRERAMLTGEIREVREKWAEKKRQAMLSMHSTEKSKSETP